ncbi:MAG: helix-turn-helix domain-containing protein [Actinomycetota bacterium]
MARRSYRQHCGLAAALDVVAQRWALLIVRDLSPGPRRFTDLFDGLPGISTDMLAQRLRELEEASAVERVEVRSPAPATLYRLTDRGVDLARLAGELALWGAPLLPPPETSDRRFNPRWALQTLAARYRGGLPDGRFHLTIRHDDAAADELTLTLDGERARLRYGHLDGPAAASLSTPVAEFFAFRRDADGLTAQLPDGVEGSGELDRLADVFRLLPPFVASEPEPTDGVPRP